jgi:uncharacterized protein involved in response to NO
VLHAGLFGWAFFSELRLFGLLLLFGGALNFWRLLRWQGRTAFTEPLLLILHIGYLWVAVGSGLLGLSVLGSGVAQSAAIHALTAGAIGTMTLAVMTRATLGHTGRILSADGMTVLIYVLVTLAAISRVVAGFSPEQMMPLIEASAFLWIAAFGLFVLRYGPMMLRPRIGQ